MQKALEDTALLALVKLGTRLVNDESEKCKKFIAAALRKLYEAAGESARQDLMAATLDWLQNEKVR